MELINKQAAIDALYHVDEYNARSIEAINNLPSAQPKHGEWEYHSNPTIGINTEVAYCSCCGFRVDTTGDIDFDEYNFCPRCGADMRGERNECRNNS